MNTGDSQVMNFIRRDGLAGAPICFLTIEDGGETGSEQEFFNYIRGSGVWEPGRKKRDNLGVPGYCISKIMSGLLFGDLDKATQYRNFAIYFSNEWNLKFFPIGRPNVSDWQDYYTKASGLQQNEYLLACKVRRPAIIWDQYGPYLERSKIVVILGSRNEWLKVLEKAKTFEFETFEVEKHGSQWKWAFYFRADGSLAFAYFGMFVQGITDEDRLQFSILLRQYAIERIAPHIPNMVTQFERSLEA